MSRAQECAEILGIPTVDPRMLAIPLGSSGLWLRLVEAMRRMRSTTLRFGDHAPDGAELARALAVSQQELDECLDPLVRVGLLLRETDGALTSPLLVDQAERRRLAAERREAARAALERAIEVGEVPQGTTLRAMTAQMNGRKGGRPRKDGEAAGQRNMPFFGVVPSTSGNPSENPTGFSGKPSEDKPGTASGFLSSRGLTDCLPEDEQSGRQAAGRAGAETQETQRPKTQETQRGETQRAETQAQAPAELDRIGHRILALAGLPAKSWGANSRGIVAGWLSTGLSEAELVATAEEALRGRPRDVRSLGWFTPVFRQAADDRPPADPEKPVVKLSPEQERRFQAASQEWVAKVTGGDLKARRPSREAFAGEDAA